ncbi:MAG: DUF3363 domain-containing protein [Rhizobiaceae bacterium]
MASPPAIPISIESSDRSEGDPHQFRIIVAAQDGAEFQDLKPFIRDLMCQAEADLGTKLDWAAVDHFNTGHPHTHIVVRGRDDQGRDLIIARDYISQGLRERARDLATLELGPESEDGFHKKLAREVQAERFTRLDRAILRDADDGILAISSRDSGNRRRHAHRMGRLQRLKTMGLAEELKSGVWKIADRAEDVLRHLGQRGDIMKTMQPVLKDAGIDRGALDYAIFDATKPNARITGKIVAMGLSDELQDHRYVVVDGTDGKLHYAEIGRLNKYEPPSREMVATLRGHDPEKQHQSRRGFARILIESHIPFRALADADGATWLDRQLVSKVRPKFTDKGFGAEAKRALRLRQQWLVREGLMTEQNGQLIVRRNLLETLQRRELNRVVKRLQNQLGLNHRPAAIGDRLKGQVSKTVRLASGRFALLQKGKEFSLVPWREAIRLRRGVGVGIDAKGGISR